MAGKKEETQERGLRITTWNVNGIRNPFGYQPWRQERTFSAMFEILQTDIVVMQETKIQKKDLQDDMVLVPGWDVFFSLPKHKKGYSGVAIYTRNSLCAPIRAEEGITGILTPPNSSTSFCDLPKDQQIGGYPTSYQLSDCTLDAATLDSEGRCMILEFPAFVLIGTYCPATRDESRDEFRLGFLNALDARVRNLVALGKRVFLTGDLNIMREEIDTANIDEMLKKRGVTAEEFFSSPSRRMLNQLLVGGKVYGEKDEGKEKPVMWDICRSFHPTRKGMFTCWEQKINARPGNFGSRIDYVLCSQDWKGWFCDSNIQEGLIGSDHCPVYATLKQKVEIDGKNVDIRDIMSSGMYKDGIKVREWNAKDLLPTSAKLIPEFDRRRSIRDMFARKPSLFSESSQTIKMEARNQNQDMVLPNRENSCSRNAPAVPDSIEEKKDDLLNEPHASTSISSTNTATSPIKSPVKRPAEVPPSLPQKRGKTVSKATAPSKGKLTKGQSSLKGFFKPKAVPEGQKEDSMLASTSSTIHPFASKTPPSNSLAPNPFSTNVSTNTSMDTFTNTPTDPEIELPPSTAESIPSSRSETASPSKPFNPADQESVIDPIVAKESWSKLMTKRIVPRCDHNEPCISHITKKPGVNCGRSFFMCPRPLGPSGQKERNTQWRCGTFIWSSDWTADMT